MQQTGAPGALRALFVAAIGSLAVACGSNDDPLDSHGVSLSGVSDPSGGGPGGGPSGDEPGTSGDEPTGGTSGSTGADETTGGLQPTRELCDRYLECLAVTRPEELPAAQMGFGADGTCWEGPPEQISQCITACYTGIGDVHEAFPDEPKCVQCEQDTDCITGERCVYGGCYVSYCGDELVEDDEICDNIADDPYCNYDCSHQFLECNVLSNFGCEEGEHCDYGYEVGLTRCRPGEAEDLGDGALCDLQGSNHCAAGLACVPAEVLAVCAGDSCCTPLCNAQEPDDCADERVCELQPPSNYIGVCVLY